jgi:hypothetical protein
MLLAVEIIIGLVFVLAAILLILGMCKCAAMEPPESIWADSPAPDWTLRVEPSRNTYSGNAHDRRLARRQQARAAKLGAA